MRILIGIYQILKEPEFKITILYGVMKLAPEFVWIRRKTIRGFFKKHEYYIHTPYLSLQVNSYEEALMYKWMFKRV